MDKNTKPMYTSFLMDLVLRFTWGKRVDHLTDVCMNTNDFIYDASKILFPEDVHNFHILYSENK